MADRPAGQTIVEVDYDRYADGEAALGWLNATVRLQAAFLPDWKQIALDLLEAMRRELQARKAEIAHVKIFLQAGKLTVAGNATSNQETAFMRATGDASDRDVTAGLFVNDAFTLITNYSAMSWYSACCKSLGMELRLKSPPWKVSPLPVPNRSIGSRKQYETYSLHYNIERLMAYWQG